MFSSFDIVDGEDFRYCSIIRENSKYLMDVDNFGWNLEHSYNSVVIGHS